MNLVIYTNILTPYRKYFYDLLYEECRENGDQFHVLVMSETEPGRRWKYSDFASCYTHLLKGNSLVRGGGIHTYQYKSEKNVKKAETGFACLRRKLSVSRSMAGMQV